MADKKHKTQRRNPADEGDGPGKFFLFFTVSFICHLIFFVSFVFLPGLAPAKRYSPPVINVSLVSIPAPSAEATSVSKVTDETMQTIPPKKPAGESKEAVPLEPHKIKPKTSLKKKTFKSSKVIEKAISSLEKEVEDSRPPSVQEALDKLKRQVEETDPEERLRKKAVEGVTRKGAGTGDGTLADRQKFLGAMQIYNAEIKYQIQQNWVFSEQFAGGKTDLETALGIKVLPSGEITDIWFDQKSGNTHLDDSAYKALRKSNPLPPLPKEFTQPYYMVGFRFGPKGLK